MPHVSFLLLSFAVPANGLPLALRELPNAHIEIATYHWTIVDSVVGNLSLLVLLSIKCVPLRAQTWR